VLLPLADGDLRLVAIDMAPAHRTAFSFLEGDAASVWPAFDSAGGVLVSESWAYRRGAHPGSTLRLPTDRGEREFPIVGVFRDYASEHGVVFMSRRAYLESWNDPAITSLGVFASQGADADSLIARLRALDTGARVISFRPNRGLREASLEIFDRTFAITAVLRLLALAVAFVGVLSALMAVQLERGRELAVLRATGLTPRQLWALVTSETGLMGLAAAVLSTPLGLLLAWAMINVVNRRSFGWTIDMRIDGGIVLQAFALAIISSVLAGMYPAWRMARTRPAMGLREE
jgi:putative ABC transport system permease protein